jgi:hypothetical protein
MCVHDKSPMPSSGVGQEALARHESEEEQFAFCAPWIGPSAVAWPQSCGLVNSSDGQRICMVGHATSGVNISGNGAVRQWCNFPPMYALSYGMMRPSVAGSREGITGLAGVEETPGYGSMSQLEVQCFPGLRDNQIVVERGHWLCII